MDASDSTRVEVDPPTAKEPTKRKPQRRRARRKQREKRADIFAGFDTELRAIDWNNTIRREAQVSAVIGRLIVQVATVPKLTKEERERLQWVTQLARQLKDFRDTSEIDAALRLLNGDGMKEEQQTEGPAMVAAVARNEHEGESSGGTGTSKAIRGRPRARGFA